MVEYLNCRDLGEKGIFLRIDYSVNCESTTYKNFVVLAMFGILLYSLGIPLLFSIIIHFRRHPLFKTPSLLLYKNFVSEWRYFEGTIIFPRNSALLIRVLLFYIFCVVYDLLRKFLLTSMIAFVSHPGSATQCLYLLLVDLLALNILAFARPYIVRSDDILSSVFVTTECVAFLVALIILSGISTQENYHEMAMFDTLFSIALVSLAFVAPVTFAMKFDSAVELISRLFGLHLAVGKKRKSSSLDVCAESPVHVEMKGHPNEGHHDNDVL